MGHHAGERGRNAKAARAAARKRSEKTNKEIGRIGAAVGAAALVASQQSKKSAKRRSSSGAVSPEYAAAVRLAQEQAEAEAVARAAAPKVRRPVTPGRVRLISAIFILVGLIATLLFWPVGLGIVAISIYCVACAGKIADQQNERAGLSAADQDGGGDL